MKQNRFRFSDEERENLGDQLHRYPRDHAWRFLVELEAICRQRGYLKPFPELADHRRDIGRIVTNIEAVLGDLRRITRKKKGLNVIPQILFNDMRGEKVGQVATLNMDAVDKAATAHDALIDLAGLLDTAQELLESEKPNPNRPASDVDGFIMEIGQAFNDCLGAPQSSKAGTFAHVVYETMKILESRNPSGGHIKMPQRGIERVAKAIKAPQ